MFKAYGTLTGPVTISMKICTEKRWWCCSILPYPQQKVPVKCEHICQMDVQSGLLCLKWTKALYSDEHNILRQRPFLARNPSRGWAAFALPLQSLHPLVSVLYPLGPSKINLITLMTAVQIFEQSDHVPPEHLFSKLYILKSFLDRAHIPGPSMSWLSLWHPGLKTLTQSVAEYREQRSTCYLCWVFIIVVGSLFVLKLIKGMIK